MGYFPNGTAWEMYESKYCDKCKHFETCPIIKLHMLHNYEECNKPNSFLHEFIPIHESGLDNLECKMFMPWDENRCLDTKDMFD